MITYPSAALRTSFFPFRLRAVGLLLYDCSILFPFEKKKMLVYGTWYLDVRWHVQTANGYRYTHVRLTGSDFSTVIS